MTLERSPMRLAPLTGTNRPAHLSVFQAGSSGVNGSLRPADELSAYGSPSLARSRTGEPLSVSAFIILLSKAVPAMPRAVHDESAFFNYFTNGFISNSYGTPLIVSWSPCPPSPAILTSWAKAASSWIARSDSTFRSSTTPARERPLINWL